MLHIHILVYSDYWLVKISLNLTLNIFNPRLVEPKSASYTFTYVVVYLSSSLMYEIYDVSL